MEKRDLITVRDYQVADKNFVYSTFLRGLYYGDSWFTHIPKNIFMENYHTILDRLLESPNTQIKVACLKEDQEVILGYSILNTGGTALHWVFTKSAWRNIGIAKSLVPESVSTVTHLTKVGIGILNKRRNVVFNPFAI